MFVLQNVQYKNIINISNLKIAPSQTTCITGESGSGKTTLLKLLNNLISCDDGVINYKGHEIGTIDSVQLRREVVMLPQTPIMFPGTVKENLLIGLQFTEKDPVNDGLLMDIMELMGLNFKLDSDTANLSGGEKQRLAIGRILLMRPELILMDEPTSALDENTGNTVIKNVTEYISQDNKGIVMVTHSRSIAERYGETIIILDKGKAIHIQEAGKTNG